MGEIVDKPQQDVRQRHEHRDLDRRQPRRGISDERRDPRREDDEGHRSEEERHVAVRSRRLPDRTQGHADEDENVDELRDHGDEFERVQVR